MAGESLGRGLVVDFSRYFRRIVADEGDRVRVQPGVVLASLNRYLGRSGRLFGPDPAMRSVTTMGSVVAIDAGGSHWPRYGSARRHVEELQIVLADGNVLRVGRHPIDHARTATTHGDDGRPADRLDELGRNPSPASIERHARTIDDHRPQSLVNRSGYRLDDVLADGQLDLAQLLVGSEGTLALITEATLTVDPLPAHRGCVLLLFDSLDKAAHAALEIARSSPAACDLMDRRHLNLARETDVRYELLIPGEAEAMLLVEHHADSRDELRRKLDEVVELAQYKTGPRRRRARRRGRSRLPAVSGASPSDSCRRCTACRARRGRCRASKTSPCRSRRCPFSCGMCRTRSSGCKSPRRSSATRPKVSCTFARFSIWRIPTTCARWNRSPASCTKKSGCSAARSAASTATA